MKTLQWSALALMLFGVSLMAQEPGPNPIIDAMFYCNSPTAAPFTMHYKRFPDAIQTDVNQLVMSSDAVAPNIAAVIVSGGSSVLGNTAKINPLSNGVPFTVSASDDVGITSASLYIDGKLATAAADGDGLPSLFYLRWNARAVAPGVHAFRLLVWDKAGNLSEKTWTMER